ncbi:MAG: pseudouridine synthase [Planctomycetota bacterium]|nr:pseudouridine synthase [Planctomycetota bacterium]
MARRKAKRPPITDAAESQASESPQAVRLQRYLASAGFGSRRSCEEFILAGRVTVDGKEERTLGASIDPRTQKVCLDGEFVRIQRKRYYILNKPKGYLCTNLDPAGRKRAIDLIAENDRLFTVGRLDENSQGLLFVTNDGEMGNRLAHPRYEVSRTYRVHVVGIPTLATLDELRKGIHFPEGRFQVHGIKQVKVQGKSSVLEMHLKQGRNREIRRMLARVGHKVMSLERVSFGPLRLRGVGVGKYRSLKPQEIQALRDLLSRASNDPDDDAPTHERGRRPPSRKRVGGRRDAASGDHRHKMTRGTQSHAKPAHKTAAFKQPAHKKAADRAVDRKDVRGKSLASEPARTPTTEELLFGNRKKSAHGNQPRGKASGGDSRGKFAPSDERDRTARDDGESGGQRKRVRGKKAFGGHRNKTERDDAASGEYSKPVRGKSSSIKKRTGGKPAVQKAGKSHAAKKGANRTALDKKVGSRQFVKKVGPTGKKNSTKKKANKKGGSRGRRR